MCPPHAELGCGHGVRFSLWRVRSARVTGRSSKSDARCAVCSLPPHAVKGAAEGGRPDSHRPAGHRARARNKPLAFCAPATCGSVVSTGSKPISTDTPYCRLSRRPQKTAAAAWHFACLLHLFVKVPVYVATGGNLVRSTFLHAALKSFCETQRSVRTHGVERVIWELPAASDGHPLTSRRHRLSGRASRKCPSSHSSLSPDLGPGVRPS